jgi:o-succinylbenzoate synthase
VKLDVWRTGSSVAAFTARGRTAAERPILLLRVSSEGALGLGEVAPLPELDGQTVDAALSALTALAAVGEIPAPTSDRGEALRRASPALSFGLELALASRHAGSPGALTPAADAAGPLRNTRLLGALSDPGLEALARRVEVDGFAAVKVKLGPQDRVDAARHLSALRAWIGGGVELRVDCNGALSPADVLGLAPAFVAARVAFVEEPCAFERLDELAPLTTPIFVDESLARLGPSVLTHPRVRGAALKPTILGGLTRTRALASEARRHGREFYVSHTFEGPIAMAGLEALARALEPGAMAHGLDRSHLVTDAPARVARELDRPPDRSWSLEEPTWTP